MLTITLLKCENLSREISLEDQYRESYQRLYENIDPLLTPEEQATKIEEEAFEITLKLNLNSVGISERKIFVIRRESQYIHHPFCIGNFIFDDTPDSFIDNLKIVSDVNFEDDYSTIEDLFGFRSVFLVEGLYFQPDWIKLNEKLDKLIKKVVLLENSYLLKNYELFLVSLKIIKSTIELVMRQNDKDHYYFQWIYS